MSGGADGMEMECELDYEDEGEELEEGVILHWQQHVPEYTKKQAPPDGRSTQGCRDLGQVTSREPVVSGCRRIALWLLESAGPWLSYVAHKRGAGLEEAGSRGEGPPERKKTDEVGPGPCGTHKGWSERRKPHTPRRSASAAHGGVIPEYQSSGEDETEWPGPRRGGEMSTGCNDTPLASVRGEARPGQILRQLRPSGLLKEELSGGHSR
ncbi:hypothetical protein NDU88_005889 [Pleurodeles waltl]|uniref:Uncharacterized protein n=1 Tax=Pleurodeles waltl TaxID=8319 RepID=A0AAV7VLA3_PLEWA|nr:hypothetical protein NDU88_005889 [Pleurodeles waltl]